MKKDAFNQSGNSPPELTFTQEQKLRRLAKRIKFDEAEIAKGAAGLIWRPELQRAEYYWNDDTDRSEYPWQKQDAIIAKVLGRLWTPTVHNEEECGVCLSGHYACNRKKDHDPLYCVAKEIAHEICFQLWHDAIYAYYAERQKAVR
jgi:hypothetical protein